MKTPMQEHIEWMQEKLRILVEYKDLSAGAEVDECIQHAEAMLEKEKDVMCDFVEYCDEANRNYQDTEESWCEDLTIDDMFDKRFNTKEK